MGDGGGDHLARGPGENGFQCLFLRPAAGEQGSDPAAVPLQRGDAEAHRFSNPGENGDVPGGTVGDPQRSLLTGNASGKWAHTHQQIVVLIAEKGHSLHYGPLRLRVGKRRLP